MSPRASVTALSDLSTAVRCAAASRRGVKSRSIYLLAAWQRKGLGRRLLASAARHLAALSYESLAIWALEANHARAFYEAMGGALADQRQIRFAGAVLDEVCYRWPEIASLLLADLVAEHAQDAVNVDSA